MDERAFNLLDEPWLPVRLADGRTEMLGLLEVFRRSSEITALAETAPPSLVAQYRLLLAILHRALSRAHPQGWKDKERARWYRQGLPVDAVCGYLEDWRERFWLFHPERPFMQVAALAEAEETCDKFKPWTQIALASANGNTPVVFDHACDSVPSAIDPALALNALLGFLQFTPGGLVKVLRDSDKAGALANTAAILPLGETLAKTLLLCLHPWRGEEDLPAWERAAPTLSELRGKSILATGSNDRYTRQSRAVLLRREADGRVQWLHFAAGLALEEDGNAPDPMASFRTGSNGNPVRVSFVEGRAFWRDLPVLVPNPQKKNSQPAAVLSYAMTLHDELDFEPVYQPLLVAGLASDQAKLLRWRLERISLPLALLEDADRALYLCELVAKAETVFGDIRALATYMLAESMPEPSHKDTRSRARSLLDTGSFASSYFASAERFLPEVLRQLGDGQFESATRDWNQALRSSASTAWHQVVQGMGLSVSALRSDAKYLPRFHALLNKHFPRAESHPVYEEAAA
ncbi:type I-E CRISPR-associated protein Cse1/CasA [Vandammella animalimorsus]|uniref:Type I-E CRISPR-associated protein Cse1/CasA n=1 Tax=Vandammella animalimorsus TaxID=2029117 RepID=A0A3M6RIX7_9BURK|nr:type I-E CRISPR-associated protein Cse1/CasA [Vandammella animalimorsus]RMX15405.1 type I-E CRISPR-associated protein Cse1/CasA [Vandammella animalimorsus]